MIRFGKWFAGLALGLFVAGSVQAQTGGFGQSNLGSRSAQATPPPPDGTINRPTSNGITVTAGGQQAALQELIAQIQALTEFVAGELDITPATPEEEMLLFYVTAQLYFAVMREQSRSQSGFGGRGFGGGGFGGGGSGGGSGGGTSARGFGGFGGRGTGTASGTGGFGGGSLQGGPARGAGTTGTTSGRNR